MKTKKYKSWAMPSEDGLLGLLLEAGGETAFFMYDNDYEQKDDVTKALIATSIYPVYLAKMAIKKFRACISNEEYRRG